MEGAQPGSLEDNGIVDEARVVFAVVIARAILALVVEIAIRLRKIDIKYSYQQS